MTPHIGYVTEESYRRGFEGMVEVVKAWQDGVPINRVEKRAA
jgi:phosphoglycerate dehydrogenase-like enzyme